MNQRGFAIALDLLRQQRFNDAGVALERLLPQAHAHPQIWHWLGYVRWRQGKTDEARRFMERALQAEPANTTFLVNIGALAMALDEPSAAARYFQDALTADPNLPSAHNNLGNALRRVGQIDAAGQHYEAALALQPDLPEAHNNLANIRKEQGDVAAALRHYEQALDLRPTFREAFSNLLALTKLIDTMAPRDVLDLHRQFAERFETPHMVEWARQPQEPAVAARKLRVGYVSPDCHPAASFFLKPVFECHDRAQFDVFAYFDSVPRPPLGPDSLDGIVWRVTTGLTDSEVAAMVRGDNIDVLIDVAGHAGNSRILVFARRPAPVQITWLDYLGTTGLRAMDFRLTDRWADPAGAERYHSERLLKMPEGYCQWCYPGPSEAPEVAELPATQNGFVTFASFNNPIKITPATLDLWTRVLAAVPGAHLHCIGVGSAQAGDVLLNHFRCHGQADRLKLLPALHYSAFLAACNDVDVALDPLLFSGATTTCDVLWMGVPVITLCAPVESGSSASRSTTSILNCLGLSHLAARTNEGYVDVARALTDDLAALAKLRGSLRATMRSSPLMDAKGFTRELERLLQSARSMARRRDCPSPSGNVGSRLTKEDPR